MRLREFLKPWKHLIFIAKIFDEKEYEFKENTYAWSKELSYTDSSELVKILDYEIVHVKIESKPTDWSEQEIKVISDIIYITLKELK